MKIFSSAQIKEWDQFTISHEPISSVDLMERAAAKCAEWITKNIETGKNIILFCGNGNNGGDGLAIARILFKERKNISVYVLSTGKRSADCDINLQRLKELQFAIDEIETAADFPEIDKDDIVIDALFGTGLNKPLDGIAQVLVQYINQSEAEVISIDVPTGLFTDISSKGNTVIKAKYTLSFQCNKLAFMFAENGIPFGRYISKKPGGHINAYHFCFTLVDDC